MSVHVSARVWRAKIEPTEKLVLLALADVAEHDGAATHWRSVPRMAAECGLSERTVQRTLRALEAKAWVVVEHEPGDVIKGKRVPTRCYRVMLDALPGDAYAPARQTAESLNEGGCHPVTPGPTDDERAPEGTPGASEGHSARLAAESPEGCHGVTPLGQGEGDTMSPVTPASPGGCHPCHRGGDTGVTQSVRIHQRSVSPPYPPMPENRQAGETDPSLEPGAVSDRSRRSESGETTDRRESGDQAGREAIDEGTLGRAKAWMVRQARAELGARNAASWIEPLAVEAVTPERIVLRASSRFMAEWVVSRYAERLADWWRRPVVILGPGEAVPPELSIGGGRDITSSRAVAEPPIGESQDTAAAPLGQSHEASP